MGFLRTLFTPRYFDVWRRFAADTGAEFVEPGFWRRAKVRLRLNNWTLTLDTFTTEHRHGPHSHSRTTYTRLRAPFVNPDGFHFIVHRHGMLSRLGKFLGWQDIEVGDTEFDRAFVVGSNDEFRVRSLLEDATLRRLLQARGSGIVLQVKDHEGWFGPRFPANADELYYHEPRLLDDPGQLAALHQLFIQLFAHLTRLGIIWEDDPGVQL